MPTQLYLAGLLIGGVMLGASLLLRSDDDGADEGPSIIEGRNFRIATYGLATAGLTGLVFTGLGWPASDVLVAVVALASAALAGWFSARMA